MNVHSNNTIIRNSRFTLEHRYGMAIRDAGMRCMCTLERHLCSGIQQTVSQQVNAYWHDASDWRYYKPSFNEGGSLSSFAKISDTKYTATFTPDGENMKSLVVYADLFQDKASNENLASNTFEWTYVVFERTCRSMARSVFENINREYHLYRSLITARISLENQRSNATNSIVT